MNASHPAPSRRHLFVFAVAAVLAVVGGTVAAQHVGADSAHMMSLAATPADFAEHITQFSAHLYTEAGATAEQKAQIDPILKQAGTDLAALHMQLHDSHASLLQALTQDQVDRTALENARAEHMRIADQVSQRMAKLAADVADVLTPAQRKTLAQRIAQYHAAGHMGSPAS
jgi:Spy/CpxP family protein refolding chaperone